VSAPTDTVVVGYRWVYTLKYRADGSMDHYKARLMAKDYTKTYDIDYFETFSPFTRIKFLSGSFSLLLLTYHGLCASWMSRMLSYMVIFRRKCIWNNLQVMLLRGRIRYKKAIYGKQSPRSRFEKFNITISGIDFHRCYSNHSAFVQRTNLVL